MPYLRFLHSEETISQAKLEMLAKGATGDLVDSLKPGREECLKVREDGLILDGNHRIRILKDRGVNVDVLPREIIPREDVP